MLLFKKGTQRKPFLRVKNRTNKFLEKRNSIPPNIFKTVDFLIT